MPDYLGDRTREQLEVLITGIVAQRIEGPKIDFKRDLELTTRKQKAELAADISSIANTDDERYDDYGYLIIGAHRGEISGGVAQFDPDNCEAFQTEITNVLREYLLPVPLFSLVGFVHPEKGPWGAIVISPSAVQPHIIIRDSDSGDKHDFLVRVNDRKDRGGAADYQRFLEKAIRRNVSTSLRQGPREFYVEKG